MLIVLGLSIATLGVHAAKQPGLGELYYEGMVVKTIVPPAAMTQEGMEAFYGIPDQRPVIATAPGDKDYRGGKWAFHSVTWNVEPYELTSVLDVLTAWAAFHINIDRVPENDFKCPVQK